MVVRSIVPPRHTTTGRFKPQAKPNSMPLPKQKPTKPAKPGK